MIRLINIELFVCRHEKYEECQQPAKEFLHYLMQQQDPKQFSLSMNAYTFALMTILKTNDLAKQYSTRHSFTMVSKLLDNECLNSYQVSYNVLCMLWILSYHDFTTEFFEDYTMAIIEKVTKVMDYHSKEKIARIMLMLFDNLKEMEGCQDHLSEIDALNLIIKLQNRHWVDEDINTMLENLYKYFEENQKVYSSIEKFRKQVERKQLRWGPCHTEKFWQENAYLFDNQDNLKLINVMV